MTETKADLPTVAIKKLLLKIKKSAKKAKTMAVVTKIIKIVNGQSVLIWMNILFKNASEALERFFQKK